MSNMQRYFIFILTSLVSIELCGASGTVLLRLDCYNNPDNKLENGHCCDVPFYWCPLGSACDHSFSLCLDELNGSLTDMNQCGIGKYQTGIVWNKKRIDFGLRIGSIPNPKKFKFHSWPGGIRLKVKVFDKDNLISKGTFFVEFLSTEVRMEPSRSRDVAKWKDLRAKKRTQLDLKLKVFCDKNWYGSKCVIYCSPIAHCNCKSAKLKYCDRRNIGCYKDDSDRPFPKRISSNDTKLTNDKCIRACGMQNYTIAGTKDGRECFCGYDNFTLGARCDTAKNCSCDVTCQGESADMCGGRHALSVHRAECREADNWGKNCTFGCHCKNEVGCNMTTGRCPNDECAPGWAGLTCNKDRRYLGCYKDAKDRALPSLLLNQTHLTTEKCIRACGMQNYTFAGTENGKQCFCGNGTYSRHGRCNPTKSCTCNSTCQGNSYDVCGGYWAISVHKAECIVLGKWGSDCDKSCHCQDGVACNMMTGKCPRDECARGWGGYTCNQTSQTNTACQGTTDTSDVSPALKLMDDDLNTCESIETSSTNSQLIMPINKVLRVPVVTITSNLTCSPFDGIFVMMFPKCLGDAYCNGYSCVPQMAEPVTLPDGNRLFSCKFYCDGATGFMFVNHFVVGAVDNAALVCEIHSDEITFN